MSFIKLFNTHYLGKDGPLFIEFVRVRMRWNMKGAILENTWPLKTNMTVTKDLEDNITFIVETGLKIATGASI